MTNIDTAPQPVIDEQTQAANAPEPITITAEGPFGIVSWTPGEHQQKHLHELGEEGTLEKFLSSVQDDLSDIATAHSMSLCLDKSSIMSLVAAIFGTDGQMSPFNDAMPRFGMDDVFGDIANGRYPRF